MLSYVKKYFAQIKMINLNVRCYTKKKYYYCYDNNNCKENDGGDPNNNKKNNSDFKFLFVFYFCYEIYDRRIENV
jgi:hypothetical protein